MTRARGLLLVCLLLTGCGSLLAPSPDHWRFFTLTALPQAAAGAAGGNSNGEVALYGLGPIHMPAYLDRGEIAARVSPTEVAYSHTDRWAEPLPVQVASILQQNLSGLLGTTRILVYPWQTGAKIDEQIEITLRQFECEPSGACRLEGRWSIQQPRSGRFLEVKETSLTGQGAPGSDAAILSQILGDLSQEIATALQSNPPPRP